MPIRAFVVSLLASLFVCACAVTGDEPEVRENIEVAREAITVRVGPISDESSHNRDRCPLNQGIFGMQCTGRYCDNIYLYCDRLPANVTLDYEHQWRTDWFSEESPNSWGWCDSGNFHPLPGEPGLPGIVTGIACSNDYCDNMQLECTALKTGHFTTWATGATFSDEDVAKFWSSPLVGLGCTGRYCDNLTSWPRNVTF